MTIAERIQLHKLGYTKEEINVLANEGYNPAGLTDPPVDPPAAEEPQQETEPTAEQEPQPLAEPAANDYAMLAAEVKTLREALQQHNIQQSQQPEVKQPTVEETFLDIVQNY